jgi:4-amino-4-deoxy-L-arabinose transferase-like glycosyltransferase
MAYLRGLAPVIQHSSVKFSGTSERLAWLYCAVMAPYAIVMLYRLGAMPIQVWDEARLANNAIEMAYGGLSLVTTYDGLPDHWNTKPPLLIWIMAMAIQALGASEWAIRLPSALASVATATMVFWFGAVYLKKPLVGVVSVLVMLATPSYVLSHGARSGDYDAMLVLWTTAYLLSGYLYLHALPMQRSTWLYLCTAGILLAFMTKTVQGLIMVPPLLIYAWLSGRLGNVVRSRQFYICVLGVFVVCLSYYVLREVADPGYFAATLVNDVVGRYASVLDGHQGGPLWYLLQYRDFAALVPGLAAAGYFAWHGPATTRSLSVFFGLTAVFYLAVISSASTKLPWYSMPLCPLMAILIGIGVDRLNDLALERWSMLDQRLRYVSIICCIIAAVVAVGTDIRKINNLVQATSHDELDRIGLFLRSLASTRNEHLDVAVVHPGYPNDKGDPFYVAPALFYARILLAQGHNVGLLPPTALAGTKQSELVVCGRHMLDQALAIMVLRPAKLEGSCGLYTVSGLRRR